MATTESTTRFFREDYTLNTRWSVDHWSVFYRAGKDIPSTESYRHHRIVVTAGLHQIGDQTPYWSVSGDLINKRQRRDNGIEASGTMHEIILEHFPELAPVIALHLSDPDGVPIYAVENGAYWLGLTEWKQAMVRVTPDGRLEERDLPWFPYVARHFRISEDEARNLATWALTSLDVKRFVRQQRARWAGESLEALTLLRRLGTEDGGGDG